MFKCAVCVEKDNRIADLKEELKHLRAVLNPPARVSRYEIEQDNILGGANSETIKVNEIDLEAEILETRAAQREADLIWSGNVIESEG